MDEAKILMMKEWLNKKSTEDYTITFFTESEIHGGLKFEYITNVFTFEDGYVVEVYRDDVYDLSKTPSRLLNRKENYYKLVDGNRLLFNTISKEY